MATEAGTFAAYPYDDGIDVNNLPDAPWTPLALGKVFYALANVMGAGDIISQRNPSLDIRQFAEGRMRRLMRLEGLHRPPKTIRVIESGQVVERAMTENEVKNWFDLNYADESRRDAAFTRIAELEKEAQALQAAINAKLSAPTGTPRNENARPLTGATTQKKTRTY